MAANSFTTYKNEIEEAAKKSAKTSGRDSGNIEDQIRTANDLLRGLKILNKNKEVDSLEKELNSIISAFAKSILESEKAIATAADDKRENAYSVLVNFLLSFASRTGNRERLNIFTTNYDRLIEVGAELAGIHLMDRFVGTMMPIFRSSRLNLDIHYNPPGIRGEPRYLEGVARLTDSARPPCLPISRTLNFIRTAKYVIRTAKYVIRTAEYVIRTAEYVIRTAE